METLRIASISLNESGGYYIQDNGEGIHQTRSGSMYFRRGMDNFYFISKSAIINYAAKQGGMIIDDEYNVLSEGTQFIISSQGQIYQTIAQQEAAAKAVNDAILKEQKAIEAKIAYLNSDTAVWTSQTAQKTAYENTQKEIVAFNEAIVNYKPPEIMHLPTVSTPPIITFSKTTENLALLKMHNYILWFSLIVIIIFVIWFIKR